MFVLDFSHSVLTGFMTMQYFGVGTRGKSSLFKISGVEFRLAFFGHQTMHHMLKIGMKTQSQYSGDFTIELMFP